MNHPGLFAAVATLNGVAFNAAYEHGNEPAQAYFQHMRGKNIPPVWKQLKKEVPETVWMLQWDYFRHWSRNTDGSLSYSEK